MAGHKDGFVFIGFSGQANICNAGIYTIGDERAVTQVLSKERIGESVTCILQESHAEYHSRVMKKFRDIGLRIAVALLAITFNFYLAKGNLQWMPTWALFVYGWWLGRCIGAESANRAYV